MEVVSPWKNRSTEASFPACRLQAGKADTLAGGVGLPEGYLNAEQKCWLKP
jgi:hypothetical protein